MGGYGLFIWPCYGLGLAFVIGLYWHSHKKLTQSQTQKR
ncbi:MAG: heme exporter protein CcmD [Candidatus Puniceispirillaceae bacterium]